MSDEAKTWGEFYSKVSGQKHLLVGNIKSNVPLMLEVMKYVTEGDSVLEVGTGTGVLGYTPARHGVKVVSVDNDLEVLEMAKMNAFVMDIEIEFVRGDAFNLKFSEKKFRVVFSQGLLEHFRDGEILKLVKEQLRVGDIVVFSVPVVGDASYPTFGNERLLTKEQWFKILKPFYIWKYKEYGRKSGCFTLSDAPKFRESS